jgi:hypothetical protein
MMFAPDELLKHTFSFGMACTLILFGAGTGLAQSQTDSRNLTPPTFENKTSRWMIDTFGFAPVFSSAAAAGIRMANPPDRFPREWRQGGGAFGRNFGLYYTRSTAGFTTRYLASAVLHEDTRYHASPRSGFWPRTGHAIGWVFVDQSDSGKRRLAVSNFAGALASGHVGRPFLPDGFNDETHALQWSLIGLGGIATQNLYDEFKPEIRRALRKIHIPIR